MTRRVTPLVTLFLAVASGAAWAQSPARAYVLDVGARTLVALDLASGKRTGALPLSGTPTRLNLTDDGRYVVVLDRGPGEDKEERGYKATGRSSATIVDAERLEALGRVELGFGLDSVVTVPEGRLVVTCPGYDAKNPAESLARELVIVDLAAARETGRLRLEPGTDLTWTSRDGKALALLQGLPRSAKYPFPKSKVTFVDATKPSVTGAVDAEGWNLAERDSDRLYLIEYGRPHKDPAKNRNGVIQVVHFADSRLERIDAGRAPVGSFLEGSLLGLVSEGPRDGLGELRVLREGRLVATVSVAARPAVMGRGKDAFYVVGSTAVTIVDAASAQVQGTIPLAGAVDDGDDATEMEVAADGRRAFVLYGPQHKVAVLDLEQKRVIGVAKTGRGGKKFLNAMRAGFEYQMGLIRIPRFDFGRPGRLLARPDGRYAYALNEETKDVTVIDADSGQPVEKIGGGGYEVRRLGGSIIAVVGSEIHLIDATRNMKTGEIRLSGLLGMATSHDGAFTVALAERTVLVLDGPTGKERARFTDFAGPIRIAFAPAAPPTSP